MARKMKKGIDYFSHDVDSMQDPKLKIIKAKHGLIGYAVFFRLCEEIYRDEGYFLKVDDDFKILFCDECNIAVDLLDLILKDCQERRLFDQNALKKHGILTSARIQCNYFEATERRKEISVIGDYLIKDDRINVYINRENVNIYRLNDNKSTQRKGKERKASYVHFDEFWNLYPKKKNKLNSKKIWDRLKVSEELFVEIKTHLSSAKNSDDWLKDGGNYIPLPTTYLNGARWEDEINIKKNIDFDCGSCKYKIIEKRDCWKEGKDKCDSYIKVGG